MAKRFRRGVSLLLALILIAGQLTTPVLAAEETTTTVPAPDQGTPTTESNTTTTTDGQGTTTTTTTTTTTGGGVDAKSTETYSSNASGTQQSLTTDSQSTTTDVGDTTVTTTTDENGDKVKEVSQQSTTVTEEEGESQQTQSVEPQGDGSQKVSGTDTGKSEKTETTTTTTTTKDYDQLLSDTTTDNITNNNPNDLTPGDSNTKVEADNTDLPGNDSELGAGTEWTDGKVTEGSTVVDDPNKEDSSTTEKTHFDTPNKPNVELNEENNYTVTVAIDGLTQLTQQYPGWKVEPHYDESGKQIGWKATKIIETPDFQDDSGDLTATGNETVKEEAHVTKNNVTLDSYEEQIKNNPVVETPVSMDGGLETGKEVKTYEKVYQVDENGNQVLDADGNPIFVGYKVTTTVTTEKDISDTGEIPTNDPSYAGPAVPDVDIFELPQKPDEGTTTDADGNVTTVTVEPLMENGVQTGWTIHTAFTSADGDAIRNETKNIYAKTGTETTAIEKDPVTEQTIIRQLRTYTTVEMVTADEWSKTMSVEMSKDQSSNTKIFTEEELYALTNGGTEDLVFTYQGQFFAVTASSLDAVLLKSPSSVPADKRDQGDVITDSQVATSTTVSTDKSVINSRTVVVIGEDGNPLRDENGNLVTTTVPDDLRFKNDINKNEHGNNVTVTAEFSGQSKWDPVNGKWSLYGYGLFADFVLHEYNASGVDSGVHQPKQFAIKCGDEIRYVYCVELGTTISEGAYYDPSKYSGTNEGDALWEATSADAKGTVSDIRKIAVNGYWGTESGLGSLEAVRTLMRNNGIDEQYINNLTPGIAVTATQMAIWNYGTNKSTTIADTADGKSFVTWDDEAGSAPSALDKETIWQLSNLLIDIADGKKTDNFTTTSNQIITAESISGASITVKNKIMDGTNGTTANETYNTTVKFKVSSGTLNGDLILTVTDASGNTQKFRLAGDNNASIFDNITNRIYPDEDGVFTLENVTMANGQRVNMKIQGIQDLDDGIYLYKNEDFQDFVGLSKRKHTVALEFGAQLNVIDPEFEHTSKDTHQLRTDTRQQTTNVDQVYTWKLEKVDAEGSMTQNMTNRRIIRGTVTTTKTLTEQVKENLHWEAYYEYLLTTTSGDGGFGGGGNGGPGGGNALTIPDEQVPLAVAPATGDVSYIWAAVSVLSLAAYFILSRKPKMI